MDQTIARDALNAFAAAQVRVQQKYLERMRRTYHILQGFNPFLADEVFNQKREHMRQKTRGPEESAAVVIQKRYRGHLARKLYRDLLYERYEEEEEKSREVELRRLEEGMLLLESLQLQQQIKEKQFLSRQRDIERNYAATVIQRAFRKHRHLPLPLSAITVIPDPPAAVPDPPLQLEIRESWNPQDALDLSEFFGLSGSESDSEPELFSKPHPVSQESDFEPEIQTHSLTSTGKLDLEAVLGEEMNKTSCSVLSNEPKSLSNTGGDFSMTQYMRKSQPLWRGPQALPTLTRDQPVLESRFHLISREELQTDSPAALIRRAESMRNKCASLSDILVTVLEKREEMLEAIQFSKRLIAFLTTK